MTERKIVMTIRNELLHERLRNYKNPEDLICEKGILRELTKCLLERAMSVELDTRRGYEKNALVLNRRVTVVTGVAQRQL
jgi:putative transposase